MVNREMVADKGYNNMYTIS